jgi:ribosomal protein S18 acetylase RimI-like enzyme
MGHSRVGHDVTREPEQRARQVLAATMCRIAALSGGRVDAEDGVAVFDGAAPGVGPWAGMVRTDLAVSPQDALDRARAFFAGSPRPCTIMTQGRGDADLEGHLAESGLQAIVDGPEMWIDQPIPPIDLSDDITTQAVADAGDRDAFLQVVGQAFATLGEDPAAWPLAYPDMVSLAGPSHLALVGVTADGPAGCGMLYLDDGVGHVIHIGVRPDARGRGIGARMTADLTNAAFDRGADLVTLVASPDGEPVYRRLGYQEVGRARWWLLDPDTA